MEIDFKLHAELILATGTKDSECYEYLQRLGYSKCSRTFRRDMRVWREDPSFPRAKKDNTVNEIDHTITTLYQQPGMDDKKVVKHLKKLGITTAVSTVKRHRLKLGQKHRNVIPEEQEIMYNYTEEVIRSEIEQGPARFYGRKLFTAHLGNQGLRLRKDHLTTGLSKVLSEKGRQRTFAHRNAKKRLASALYSGPDAVWSLDGHDKLKNVGIEIYAAIDAYSRYVIWLYVGISNKTQISVCKQYLESVSNGQWCPRFLRTDRGTEVPMMADLHHGLFKAFKQSSVTEDVNPLSVEGRNDPQNPLSCVIFGKSIHNHRIEAWWNQLEESQLHIWRGFNLWLQRGGFYDDSTADKVVYLYTFLPLIRAECYAYRDVWNAHKIDKDPKRPNHISGIPRELYEQDAEDESDVPPRCGFPPCEHELNAWSNALKDFDIHQDLQPDSRAWCDQQLVLLNKTSPPRASEFIDTMGVIEYRLPEWYRQLRQNARAYVANGGELAPITAPVGGYRLLFARQLAELGHPINDIDWNTLEAVEEHLAGLEDE